MPASNYKGMTRKLYDRVRKMRSKKNKLYVVRTSDRITKRINIFLEKIPEINDSGDDFNLELIMKYEYEIKRQLFKHPDNYQKLTLSYFHGLLEHNDFEDESDSFDMVKITEEHLNELKRKAPKESKMPQIVVKPGPDNSSEEEKEKITQDASMIIRFGEDGENESKESIVYFDRKSETCAWKKLYTRAEIKGKMKKYVRQLKDYFKTFSYVVSGNHRFIIKPKSFDIRYFLVNPLSNIRRFIETSMMDTTDLINFFWKTHTLLEKNGYKELAKLYEPTYVQRFFVLNFAEFSGKDTFDKAIDSYFSNQALYEIGKVKDFTKRELKVLPAQLFAETSFAAKQVHYFINVPEADDWIKNAILDAQTEDYDDFFWRQYEYQDEKGNEVNEFKKHFENPEFKYKSIKKVVMEYFKRSHDKVKNIDLLDERRFKITIKRKTVSYIKTFIKELFFEKTHEMKNERQIQLYKKTFNKKLKRFHDDIKRLKNKK